MSKFAKDMHHTIVFLAVPTRNLLFLRFLRPFFNETIRDPILPVFIFLQLGILS